MKKFAVFDLDGTLIRWQLYHAVVDRLGKYGVFSAKDIARIKSARMEWKRRTSSTAFDKYQQQLVGIYENLLTKITPLQFNNAADEVFEEHKEQVYTYTRDLIRDLKQKGYLLFAISASQSEIVAKIAAYYGFDDFVGTTYEVKGNYFTGKRDVSIGKKDKILKALVNKHGAAFKGSVAVGDSESDIAMLDLVEKPIAFNPTIELYKHAKNKKWQIVVERKNVVYKLKKEGQDYILD